MLIRDRFSRVYFRRQFFDYPITLNLTTIRNLGPWRVIRAGVSYAHASLFPRQPERSLEDFLINRFGAELYRTFFKSYTEKVWGVPCHQISAEWGAQRIKGLSLMQAVLHALTRRSWPAAGGGQTSLIERFLYPELGPGQLWDKVAARVRDGGGTIRLSHRDVQRVAALLPYRDFITVGLILRRMKTRCWAAGQGLQSMPPDNWIYIQEPN